MCIASRGSAIREDKEPNRHLNCTGNFCLPPSVAGLSQKVCGRTSSIIEVETKSSIKETVSKALAYFESWNDIGLVSTVQHIQQLDEAKNLLENAGKTDEEREDREGTNEQSTALRIIFLRPAAPSAKEPYPGTKGTDPSTKT